MKSLRDYIQEKLVIKKSVVFNHKYFPETKEELKDLIKKRIKEEGNNADLNDIDVSKITDMSYLFEGVDFNGDISKWDVSNVTNMKGMFFGNENFNQDISRWDVSNVTNMRAMFARCVNFNQDISNWEVSNVIYKQSIFYKCPIEEKYKPKFK